MAATVVIRRLTGSGPTATTISGGNTRLSTSDNAYTNETTNPIPVPTVTNATANISSTTNASPPVLTIDQTAASLGLSNNDMVVVSGISSGATSLNGTWKCTVSGSTVTLTNVGAPGSTTTTSGVIKKANLSYWCVTRLDVTAGTYTTINNLKWYTDGGNSLGTGVAMKVATATSYVQATGTSGTTGDALSNVTGGYGGTLSGIPANAFTYTSGASLSVSGTTSSSATGQFGDRVVYQIEVDSTAGPGTTTAETITWSYDEI